MAQLVGAAAFAERFLALRKARGWTQGDVATKLGRGKTTISHWETGTNEPRIDDLVAVSALFRQSVDWLLGLEGQDLTPLHSIAEARRADEQKDNAFEKVARLVADLSRKKPRKR